MIQDDLDYYGVYKDSIIDGQKTVLTEINRILRTDAQTGAPLAEHIRSRIKSRNSIEKKLEKCGAPQTDIKTGLQWLSDIIGVRIVTHFIGDVYLILDAVRRSGVWEIEKVKDYISDPKPNGYRSLHILLRIPSSCPEFSFLTAEIQVRTVAMDCWASLEHRMKYKKNIKNTELIVSELKRCADEIASTDLSMQTIREMIQSG